MKIFYHVDDDGKCAAFWVGEYIETVSETDGYDIEYIKINYGDTFPFDKISKDEKIYIVDFSIMPDDMRKLLEITENIIWIDHHASAIERYENFEHEIKGVRLSGIAGCILTFWYFAYTLLPKHEEPESLTDLEIRESIMVFENAMPYATRLIGDYDVWNFNYGADTNKFHQGFSLYEHEPTDNIWKELRSNNPPIMREIMLKGTFSIEYRQHFMEEYCKSKGFDVEFEGHKCFAVNMGMMNSDDFIAPNIEDYDILISFSFDGKKWTYSLRSERCDCSEIAMKYGGGGHKGAAGFVDNDFIFGGSNVQQ